MSTRIYEKNGLYVTGIVGRGPIGDPERRRLEFCTTDGSLNSLDTAEVRALLVQISNWLYLDPKYDKARKL